jgi:hypothetical protein
MTEIKFHTYAGPDRPELTIIPKEGDRLIVTHADGSETTYTFGVPVVNAGPAITQRLYLTDGTPPYEVAE